MSWQGDICDFYLDSERRPANDDNRIQQTDAVFSSNLDSSYANRHRTSVSSSSGSSVWEPPSPSALIQRRSSVPLCSVISEPDEEAEDAPWNLVAYHIPWGPGYEGYEAGTLPGPDGACIFLRSPTPLKRQRTSQACDKCRERKAKCSGARPTCGRCSERGFLCVYSSGQSPVAGEIPNSPIKVHRKLSYHSSREQLKLSAKNRLRRKSSHTEATASTSLYHKTPQSFPRRHSQPVASAHSMTPLTLPSSSMLQEQFHSEKEHTAIANDTETLTMDSKGIIDMIDNPDPNCIMSRQSLNFYAQSITALDAYRFPCVESTQASLVTCSPNVPEPGIYHGVPIQYPPSILPETLWQVPEYDQQLGGKTHSSALLNIDPFNLGTNYTSMSQSISTVVNLKTDSSFDQGAYHSYFHDFRPNFEP